MDVPGLSKTLAVPSDAIVLITTHGGVTIGSPGATDHTLVLVALYVDGVRVGTPAQQGVYVANNGSGAFTLGNWSFTFPLSLPAGTHTFKIRAVWDGGSNAFVSDTDNSVTQGAMTVIVLKQ